METIASDKSDYKRGRTDEDVTCELCSQAFWYKYQLYEHLEKGHDIPDALMYIKSREDKKKLEKDISISGINKSQRIRCQLCSQVCFSKFLHLKHLKKEHNIYFDPSESELEKLNHKMKELKKAQLRMEKMTSNVEIIDLDDPAQFKNLKNSKLPAQKISIPNQSLSVILEYAFPLIKM